MKKQAIVGGIVAVMPIAVMITTRNMDVIFVAGAIAFFGLCIAYAEGCGRL